MRAAFIVAITLLGGTQVAQAATTGLVNVRANMVLRDNHYGKFRIASSNVTLDCNGFQIDFHPDVPSTCGPNGNASCGIEVNGFNNVTIKNCGLVGVLDIGVWMTNSSNSRILTSYSHAATGYRIQNTTNTSLFQADAHFNVAGHEFRNTTHLVVDDCWASDAVGDGFDDNDGFQTDYIFVWSHHNGVNGLECDGCDAPWYIAGVKSERNGQHGISLDASPALRIDEGSFLANSGDGIRVQDGSNNGQITDNVANASGGCDLRQSASTGNTWAGNSFGTRCGTVPAH